MSGPPQLYQPPPEGSCSQPHADSFMQSEPGASYSVFDPAFSITAPPTHATPNQAQTGQGAPYGAMNAAPMLAQETPSRPPTTTAFSAVPGSMSASVTEDPSGVLSMPAIRSLSAEPTPIPFPTTSCTPGPYAATPGTPMQMQPQGPQGHFRPTPHATRPFHSPSAPAPAVPYVAAGTYPQQQPSYHQGLSQSQPGSVSMSSMPTTAYHSLTQVPPHGLDSQFIPQPPATLHYETRRGSTDSCRYGVVCHQVPPAALPSPPMPAGDLNTPPFTLDRIPESTSPGQGEKTTDGDGEETIRVRNVYVAGLPLSLTESHFTNLMSAYGRVVSIRLFGDKERTDGTGRAYGFALFASGDSADHAVAELTGKLLNGHRIQARLSKNGVVRRPRVQSLGHGPSDMVSTSVDQTLPIAPPPIGT